MHQKEPYPRLNDKERELVNRAREEILSFGEKHVPAFDYTGLYLCGSALRTEDHSDVDLVFVGLDFRKLFSYDGVFLQVPSALIRQEIIIPTADIDQSIYSHDGVLYQLNPSSFFKSLYTATATHIQPSQFLLSFAEHMYHAFGIDFDADDAEFSTEFNPLYSYNSPHGRFLVARMGLGTIDLLLHAENLLVPSWKTHQDGLGLPYLILNEAVHAACLDPKERAQETLSFMEMTLAYPPGIDPVGNDRARFLSTEPEYMPS